LDRVPERRPPSRGLGKVVAIGVTLMVASSVLMYYFVSSLRIINKMTACIVQMQRPGVHPPFLEKCN
jgi:hypothetical protein